MEKFFRDILEDYVSDLEDSIGKVSEEQYKKAVSFMIEDDYMWDVISETMADALENAGVKLEWRD